MWWNIISVTVLLTVFSEIFSENTFLNEAIHIRVKRGKYYSYPSRFYRRPPNVYPVKGAFSLTPPPGYMMDDEDHPSQGPGRPFDRPKVSKKPNDGLRDEDINNIVKYLNKQDLDKLIDFASEKERVKENSIERRPYKRDESRVKDTEYSNQGNYLNGPFRIQEQEKNNGRWISQDLNSVPVNFKPQDEDNGPFRQAQQFPRPQENNVYNGPYAPTEDLLNYVQSKIVYENHNGNLRTEESMQNKQMSYLNEYIRHEINDMPNQNFFNNVQREEVLPRPVLREDFDISYSNNVPTVVKGPSYKAENFGDLPLMSNAYKLDTVSSYKVPHYTVTSNSKPGLPPRPSSSSPSVPLEPAPPLSAAEDQSDAHLKAVKIWTHQSQGTAYYLHDDGTLSLEKPGRKIP